MAVLSKLSNNNNNNNNNLHPFFLANYGLYLQVLALERSSSKSTDLHNPFFVPKEEEEDFLTEVAHWKTILTSLLDKYGNNVTLSVKGGGALAMFLLSLLVKKDVSLKTFSEFLLLGFFKDMDFSLVVSQDKLEDVKTFLKENLDNQGQNPYMLRFNTGVKVGDDFVFEMSVKGEIEGKMLSDKELPFSTVEVFLTKDKLETFFGFTSKLYLNQLENTSDFSCLETFDYYVPESTNGKFVVSNNNVDYGTLTPKMQGMVKTFTSDATNRQFIVCMLCHSFRLWRYKSKNLVKTIKFLAFLLDNDLIDLLDNDELYNLLPNLKDWILLEKFVTFFSDEVRKIYFRKYVSLIRLSLNKTNKINKKSELQKLLKEIADYLYGMKFANTSSKCLNDSNATKFFCQFFPLGSKGVKFLWKQKKGDDLFQAFKYFLSKLPPSYLPDEVKCEGCENEVFVTNVFNNKKAGKLFCKSCNTAFFTSQKKL